MEGDTENNNSSVTGIMCIFDFTKPTLAFRGRQTLHSKKSFNWVSDRDRNSLIGLVIEIATTVYCYKQQCVNFHTQQQWSIYSAYMHNK